MDDYDILSAIKVWQDHEDRVLSTLSEMLVNRDLFRIELQNQPFPEERLNELVKAIAYRKNLSEEEARYFVAFDEIDNYAYSMAADNIQILFKNGELKDAAEASDHFNLIALSKPVRKFFMAYPRWA